MIFGSNNKCSCKAADVTRRLCLLLLGVLTFLRVEAQINTTQVVQMGRAALYYDDYVTAIHYFNSVIEAKPYLAEAYYYRAYAKFSLEDYESAEQDLDKAIVFNPFRVEYYQLRGLCRIHNVRYNEAIDDYSHVLLELPEDQGSHYNRVLCRLENKDYDTANTELDYIIGHWPKFTRAYLIKAQTCLAMGDTLQSVFWVDSLLVLNKREHAAWSFKGRYALQHEEWALADSCYTQALKYDVGNADYYLERAQVRNAMNRYNLALADYDRVIEMIPQHFVAHYNRGLIRARVGDDNRAIEDFNFVILQEPDNTLAIYNRAELRQNIGDYQGAIKDYTSLLQQYPNFLYGYQQRAKCYRAVGSTAKAVRDEARVQSAELDLLFGAKKKSKIKEVRKRSDRALEHYDQLVEEDEDTTRTFMSEFAGKVQNRKAERVFLPVYHVEGQQLKVSEARQPIFCTDEELLTMVHDIEEKLNLSSSLTALDVARAYAAQKPEEAVLQYNLGCLEAESGKLEDALTAFSSAIELDPQMAEAYYNKAVVFLLINDNDAAGPLLSKAGEMGLFKAYNLLKQSKKQNNP